MWQKRVVQSIINLAAFMLQMYMLGWHGGGSLHIDVKPLLELQENAKIYRSLMGVANYTAVALRHGAV